MFNGASIASLSKVAGTQTHVQAFGVVTAQKLDSKRVRAETVDADEATLLQADIDSLTIGDSLVAPSLIVNDGNDAAVVGITANELIGARGVVLGSCVGDVAGGTDSVSVGQSNTITAAANFSVLVGQSCTSDAERNIVIGTGTTGGQPFNTMIGFGTSITSIAGGRNVLVGRATTSDGTRNVVLGDAAAATSFGDDCVSIGTSSTVTNVDRAIGIGLNADVRNNAYASVAIGANTTASETQGVVLGNLASAVGPFGVAIGAQSSTAAVPGATAVGASSNADGTGSVAVGFGSSAAFGVSLGGSSVAIDGVSIGSRAVSAASSVAIGEDATASHDDSIALGNDTATRIVNELALPGMRLVRVSTTTNSSTASLLIFHYMTTDLESIVVNGAVTARLTTAAGTNSFTFNNYLITRTQTLLSRSVGVKSRNGASALINDADVVVTGDPEDYSVRLSVAGGSAPTPVLWSGVLQIFCSPRA